MALLDVFIEKNYTGDKGETKARSWILTLPNFWGIQDADPYMAE